MVPAETGRPTSEARDRAWLGEVAALEESLLHLRHRRSEAERHRSLNEATCSRRRSEAIHVAAPQIRTMPLEP
jgi:hypothetical protein